MTDKNLNEADLTMVLFRDMARVGGISLTKPRAAALLPTWVGLIRADQRLAKVELGDAAAAGSPWGDEAWHDHD